MSVRKKVMANRGKKGPSRRRAGGRHAGTNTAPRAATASRAPIGAYRLDDLWEDMRLRLPRACEACVRGRTRRLVLVVLPETRSLDPLPARASQGRDATRGDRCVHVPSGQDSSTPQKSPPRSEDHRACFPQEGESQSGSSASRRGSEPTAHGLKTVKPCTKSTTSGTKRARAAGSQTKGGGR